VGERSDTTQQGNLEILTQSKEQGAALVVGVDHWLPPSGRSPTRTGLARGGLEKGLPFSPRNQSQWQLFLHGLSEIRQNLPTQDKGSMPAGLRNLSVSKG